MKYITETTIEQVYQEQLFLVMEIGCLECGSPDSVIGVFKTKEAAELAVKAVESKMYWRGGGHCVFEIFELPMQTGLTKDTLKLLATITDGEHS